MGSQTASIRHRRADMNLLFEASPDLFIRYSPDNTIIDIRAGKDFVTFIPIEKVLARKPSEVMPANIGELIEAMANKCRNLKENVEFTFTLKKGMKLVYHEARMIPASNREVIAIYRDISDKKLVEQELKSRSRQLASTNAALRQFVNSISHDLLEPLRSIIGFSQILKAKGENLPVEKKNRYFDLIIGSGSRLKKLISGIHHYTDLVDEDDFDEIELNDVVNDIVQNIINRFESNLVQVQVEEMPVIFSDYESIQKIFNNLIDNAFKFRKQSEQLKIDVNYYEKKHYHVFAIHDNGIGIDIEYQVEIFEMFKQLDYNQKFNGAGVGLSIAKKIIENMGGKIWVESEEGKGASFYFTLPK